MHAWLPVCIVSLYIYIYIYVCVCVCVCVCVYYSLQGSLGQQSYSPVFGLKRPNKFTACEEAYANYEKWGGKGGHRDNIYYRRP